MTDLIDFQVKLSDVFNNPDNAMSRIQEIDDAYNIPADIKREYINNFLSSYFNRDSLKIYSFFWKELKTMTSKQKNKLEIYITDWLVHIKNRLSIEEQCRILIDFLQTDRNGCTYFANKYILKYNRFREILLLIDINKYKTSQDIERYGLFSCITPYQNKTDGYIYVARTLLRPFMQYPETFRYLVKYLHRIIQLNEPYTALNELLSKEKKCSSEQYNIFILQIIYRLYQIQNNKKNIKDAIIDNKHVYAINNYSIDNVPTDIQLYIVLLYGIDVVLECCYKTVSHNRQIVLNFIGKEWIQQILCDYFQVHMYLNIETIAKSLIGIYTLLHVNKSLNIQIYTGIYEKISDIMGGMDGTISNKHCREQAFNCICNTYNDTGFSVFGELFDNLFKYINDIDIKKLLNVSVEEELTHQHKIVVTLLQMVHLRVNINENSKYIFAETLFKLISRSLDLFDIFNNELNANIKNALEQIYYMNLFIIICEIALYTLLIYESIYEEKLIDTFYPETEEKYIIFVLRIMQNINYNFNNCFRIYEIDRYKNLITKCFEIINNKLDTQISIIIEFKDTILKALSVTHLTDIKKVIEKKINDYVVYDYDYPSKFLDPITCKFIRVPIMIPDCHEIFERTSIITQIYAQGINPYTRRILTLEILETYNKKEDVVKEINKFIVDRDKWITDNVKSTSSK